MSRIKSIVLMIVFILIYAFAFIGDWGWIISVILSVLFIVIILIPNGGNIITIYKRIRKNNMLNKNKDEANFMPNRKSKIAIMLSGGVDSAVVTKLLLDQGYDVEAFFMRNWDSTTNMELNNILTEEEICQQEEDYNDAIAVAKHFNIKLHRIDFVKEYWDDVFSTFLKEIDMGLTPNPDILCNRHIKFGRFVEFVEKNHPEFEYVATGHYAKIVERNGIKLLGQAVDAFKDQTYFLAEIDHNILNKVIFPLGSLTKKEIREIAAESNIPVANKKDSTGICFIGKRNFPEFISNYLEEKKGKIVDKETGEVVGEHRGALFYTIGQRKGLNLGGFEKPYFVSDKDIKKNIIYVSLGTDNKSLLTKEINAKNFNFLINPELITDNMTIEFKTRHSEIIYDGKIKIVNNNEVNINSSEEIKAVTPGQELVLYKNGICLGGGQIK